MDNLRLFLWVGLGLMLWLTFQAWQRDYGSAPVAPEVAQDTAGSLAEAPEPAALPDLPQLPAAPSAQAEPDPEVLSPAQTSAGRIRVRTDVLDVEIGLDGGDLRRAALPAYPLKKDDPDNPVVLLNEDPATRYVFRSGLRAANEAPEPNHTATYTAAASDYVLADGEDALEVVLNWRDPSGVAVDKVYTFRRGRYNIDLEYRLRNDSQLPYQAVPYQQIVRRHIPPDRSMFDVDSYSFVGPVALRRRKIREARCRRSRRRSRSPLQQVAERLDRVDPASLPRTAAVPQADDAVRQYDARYLGRARLRCSARSTRQPVAKCAGRRASAVSRRAAVFVGPKLQSNSSTRSPEGLTLTVDYGIADAARATAVLAAAAGATSSSATGAGRLSSSRS